MYARMTTFSIPLSKSEKAIDIYKNSIIPVAEKQAGFAGAYFLVNKNVGKFISITMWDTMENAVSNQKSGYFQEQIDKFSDLQLDNPEIEGFEVAAKK